MVLRITYLKNENISHEIPVDCLMLRILGKTGPCDSSVWIMTMGVSCLFS